MIAIGAVLGHGQSPEKRPPLNELPEALGEFLARLLVPRRLREHRLQRLLEGVEHEHGKSTSSRTNKLLLCGRSLANARPSVRFSIKAPPRTL
jgi:hypothetical protein